jgi:hypothetical protein
LGRWHLAPSTQQLRAVDQRHVSEGLRKIAELPFRARIVFL